jgi:hypothetical protein
MPEPCCSSNQHDVDFLISYQHDVDLPIRFQHQAPWPIKCLHRHNLPVRGHIQWFICTEPIFSLSRTSFWWTFLPDPLQTLQPIKIFLISKIQQIPAWVALKEYWIIYREPGFLAVVLFDSFPPPSPVSKLDRRHTGRLLKRDNFLTGEGEGVGEGAKSYDGEKAWSSIFESFNTL